MRFALPLLVLVFLAASNTAGAAGDPVAGQAASAVCAACHGADGNKTLDATYPKLAGQYADYMVKVLQDYRSGARANAIMGGQASILKDKDIEDISAWFASQSSDLKDLQNFK